MPAYTIKNLKDDVEDAAPRFGLSPDLEAHFARGPLESDRFGLSYQRLAPDFRIPFGHRHADEEEVYVVIRGSGRIALGDEVIDVREMDAIRVAPERRPRLRGRLRRRRATRLRRRLRGEGRPGVGGRRDAAGLVAGGGFVARLGWAVPSAGGGCGASRQRRH